jgi:hypothetical protein
LQAIFYRFYSSADAHNAIIQAAFEAIARTLPLGSVGYENKTNEQGQRLIWLDRAMVDRLRAMRGPGESFSDVIIKLVELDVVDESA